MAKIHRGYARQDRVREQIMRELAELVRTGLKDPRAGFITINEVELTRDYSHATVYYTVLDDATREITAESSCLKRPSCTSNTTNRSNAA